MLSERSSRLGNSEKQSKITRENSLQNCQPEHLAWASVQIQCLCQWIDSSGKGVTKKPAVHSNTNKELGTGTFVPDHKRSTTSLHIGISDNLKNKGGIAGENIQEISCTLPKILFCDIDLLPGECQTFSYDETVPSGCPSTYHGKNIRFYCSGASWRVRKHHFPPFYVTIMEIIKYHEHDLHFSISISLIYLATLA